MGLSISTIIIILVCKLKQLKKRVVNILSKFFILNKKKKIKPIYMEGSRVFLHLSSQLSILELSALEYGLLRRQTKNVPLSIEYFSTLL